MTPKWLYEEVFHKGEAYDADNLGLSLADTRKFFDKFNVSLFVLDITGRMVEEACVIFGEADANKHLRPPAAYVIHHGEHVFPVEGEEMVKRLTQLGFAALRKRGGRAAGRVLGSAWEDTTSFPSLVLFATGASLQDASLRGPLLQRWLKRALLDVASLPETLAVAVLDALASLRHTGLSPRRTDGMLRAAFKDAATLPNAIAQALGFSELAALFADTLRGGPPPPEVRYVVEGVADLLGGDDDGASEE